MDTRKSLGYASAFGSAPSLWRKSPVYLIVSLICCAMLLVACNTSASGLYAPGTLAAIKSRGELVIVTRNAPTTTFFDRSGHRTGFEHDLATSFAQYLGVKPRFLYVKSVHAMLAAVKDGRADLAAGAITRTTAREKRFRFGPTYAHVSQELVCNATHKPTTIGALAEVKRIVVPADSSYAERLAALKRKYPDVHLRWQTVRDVSTQQLLAEVADGLAGCTVTDSDVFAIDRSYHPRLQTMLKLSKPQPLAWPMPKDAHALAAAAARWLAAFKKSGKLKALKARYFQFLKPQTFADKKALVESVRKIYPRYAADFARAAKKYDLNKWLLAAQAYQESHWNPDAVSPTGVRGIMMLTQPAAHAVHATDPVSAAQSIMGGAQYMRDLERKLPAPAKPPDRHYLALAAYTIGYIHLADAVQLTRRLGREPYLWKNVAQTLPLLTEPRYYQTLKYGYAPGIRAVQYVHRIRGYADIIRQAVKEQKTGRRESTRAP